MINDSFSYETYKKIIIKYRDRIIDCNDLTNKKSFVIIRHDVEFSVLRALKIAEIEDELNVKSSFFFQVRSNAYNILSTINRKKIQKINELGHNIGLHFYVTHIMENNWKELEYELLRQREILEFATGLKVDRFSYHRPPKWVLNRRDNYICDMINMYGSNLFELSDNPKKIKYIADSKHIFKYGNPLEEFNFNKMQILLHPDEWSIKGYDANENFRLLEKDHLEEFYSTLDTETFIYSQNRPD